MTLTARLRCIPLVAGGLLAGVWVAGGVITNDFRASVALTASWFVVAGSACLVIGRRRRSLRLPVLGTYVVAAAAIGGYLGLSTVRDRVVHERVVTGAPPSRVAGGNVELLRGRFHSGEHHTTGVAAVVRLGDGRRFLTLTAFATAPGPDLRVRLQPGDVDLGGLKGNRGDQQYRLPARLGLRGRTVVIWCRAFSAPFGSARLDVTPAARS